MCGLFFFSNAKSGIYSLTIFRRRVRAEVSLKKAISSSSNQREIQSNARTSSHSTWRRLRQRAWERINISGITALARDRPSTNYTDSAYHDPLSGAPSPSRTSPSTILRCLNRVALSFLTSWILSVDFLTSTWSFLLNMIRAAGGLEDRNNHRRRRPGRSASMPGPVTSARSPCQRCAMHGPPSSRQIGVKFRTHTSDQMYVTAILSASLGRTHQRCAARWHLRAMTSSVIQFPEIFDVSKLYL